MVTLMKLYALLLLSITSLAAAQAEVYVCMNPDGTREYKNDGTQRADCKLVDIKAISMIPSPYKRVAPSASQKARETLSIGMSKAAVAKSWGKPVGTRRVQTRNGLTEQWTYAGNTKLTFSNGTLEVIED
jgi:hypothetical protein